MDNQHNAGSGGRESFASQFGLIMAAVGSAVGLGNIWRFSYITGANGGGAFLLIYILCVVLVGLPLLIAELSIGRSGQASPVGSFRRLAPNTPWWLTGVLCIIAPTIIMMYYPVVAGWTLGYVFESLTNWQALTADTEAAFGAFIAGPKAFVFSGIALVLTAGILVFGVRSGLEKASKILMPVLGILLIVLVIRSCTLEGALGGIKFLLVPDFSHLSISGVLYALGHSFFSLSLGMGIMITYGSYMQRNANLPGATGAIIVLDTGIALLAGMAIFPAVFAFGFQPGSGAGLAFITLPAAFAKMPLGFLFSSLFFLLLFIAALTSLMSLMQVPLAWMEDELKLARKPALLIITVFLLIATIPSTLSFSSLADFTIFGDSYFDFLDKLANNIMLPIAGLCTALFVIFRWKTASSMKEFRVGAKNPNHLFFKIYPIAIKYITPVAIVVILLHATGVFSKLFGE